MSNLAWELDRRQRHQSPMPSGRTGTPPLLVIDGNDTALLVMPFPARRPKYLSDDERRQVEEILGVLTDHAAKGLLPAEGACWVKSDGVVQVKIEEPALARRVFDCHSCRVRLPQP